MRAPEVAATHYGRVPKHKVDELDDDQRAMVESLTSALKGRMPRSIVDDDGRISGAMNHLLLDPGAGEAFVKLGDALSGEMVPRVRELIVLEAARALRCDYEWQVHTKLARQAGLTDAEIAAILDGADRATFDERESLSRSLVRAVLLDRDVPDPLFEQSVEILGLRAVYDVVALAGYYALMATTIIAFRAPLLDGVAPVWNS